MKKYLFIGTLFITVFTLYSSPTSSLFTDQETSKGNILSAGTLDLKVGDKDDPGLVSFSFSGMVPGDTKTSSFILKNVGSIPGKPKICVKNVVNTESSGGTEFESDGGVGELGSNILVVSKINSKPLVDTSTLLNNLNNVCWSPDNVADTEFKDTGADILESNETATFKLDFNLPQSTGNEIQGDMISFDIEFNLEQN